MNSDRRPRWRGPLWAVCLVLTLVAALSAGPASADAMHRRADAIAGAPTVPTRIEGFLRFSDNQWLVETTRVLIGPHTAIEERRGKMESGAWVSVWGDMTEETLTVKVLHVLRPAGQDAPPLQFVGVLTKLSGSPKLATVSGTQVYYDLQTLMPTALPLFSQVRVSGFRLGMGVFALSIEVLSVNASSVPVNLEGKVERVTDAEIVVDGRVVRLQARHGGRVNQGDWVQVRALQAQDGTLVAETIAVIDRSRDATLEAYVVSIQGLGEENQIWDVVTFESGRAQARRVLVADETYVAEDRASMQPDIEAVVGGSKVNAVDVKAEMIWLDQPAEVEQAGRLTRGIGDGLWNLSGQPVYMPSEAMTAQARAAQAEAAGALDAVVVSGKRLSNGVLVAKGVRAASSADLAALDATGARSAASAGVAWNGPISVVNRVNGGAPPTLVFSADRTAHLVYDSDGYIHYVSRADGGAWSEPRRLARGVAPTAVLDAQGALHIAYVNTFLGNSDIFHIVWKPGGQWPLPTQVSGTTGGSNAPALAADGKGGVFIAWADHTSGAWAVHSGQYDGAYWANYPVPNARGSSPGIAVLDNGMLFLAWQDRVPTARDAFGVLNVYGMEQTLAGWYLPVNISDNATYSPGAESRDPSVVVAADGNAHIAWVDNNQQPRYDFGRGLYWPAPVNLGPRQTYANGLTLRLSGGTTLYATWDDKAVPLLTSAPIGAQAWPAAEPAPGGVGATNGASLALTAGGMAVVWRQEGGQDFGTIYEARSGLEKPLLKSWLPLILN